MFHNCFALYPIPLHLYNVSKLNESYLLEFHFYHRTMFHAVKHPIMYGRHNLTYGNVFIVGELS